MRRCRPRWIAPLATLAVVIGAPPAGAEQPACHSVRAPVALGPEASGADFVYGELCQRSGTTPATVVVLVNGASYTHLYWDFPYRRERYSMVRALTLAGYATFAIDQIDAGQSSKPFSARVTTDREADVLHQLVAGLHAGRLGGLTFAPFTNVVTGGHSSGSVVVMTEAADYQDVDGLLVTGFAHRFNSVGAFEAGGEVRPAVLDSKFAGSGLDPGYLTTTPRFRQHFMHDAVDRDPVVVALDEANKDTVTATGEVTLLPFLIVIEESPQTARTKAIRVPALVAVGGRDLLVCGAGADCTNSATLRATEAPFWRPQAQLEAFVLPGAGHAMNLALNAGDWYAAAVDWLDRRVR